MAGKHYAGQWVQFSQPATRFNPRPEARWVGALIVADTDGDTLSLLVFYGDNQQQVRYDGVPRSPDPLPLDPAERGGSWRPIPTDDE